jgi:hypothetical protein
VLLQKVLAGACALTAVLVVAAPAQARVINVTEQYETSTNDCVTGEEIVYTETLHVVARTAIVDGTEEIVDIMRFDPSAGSATGTGVVSGDEYVINSGATTRDQTNPLTLNAKFQVINKGSGADFLITEVFHTTLNANGDLTVIHTSGNVRCGDVHDHVNA